MGKNTDHKTQLVIVIGFLVLSYLFDVIWLRHISLGLGLIFLVSKKASQGILWFWDKLALILGYINTRILLSIVFYVFLLPVALLFKVFNKDPLSMNWKNTGSSFFNRDHLFKSEDLENPW